MSTLHTDPSVREKSRLEVTRRICAAVVANGGWLNREQLLRWNVQPTDPNLLWIPGHGAPAFQFASNGQIHAVVRLINRTLAERYSPSQVAVWWLLPNDQLRGNTAVDYINRGNSALLNLARQIAQGN